MKEHLARRKGQDQGNSAEIREDKWGIAIVPKKVAREAGAGELRAGCCSLVVVVAAARRRRRSMATAGLQHCLVDCLLGCGVDAKHVEGGRGRREGGSEFGGGVAWGGWGWVV